MHRAKTTMAILALYLQRLAANARNITIMSMTIMGVHAFDFILSNPNSKASMAMFLLSVVAVLFFTFLVVLCEVGEARMRAGSRWSPFGPLVRLTRIFISELLLYVANGVFTSASLAFLTLYAMEADGSTPRMPVVTVLGLVVVLIVATILNSGKTGVVGVA
jgi:hypothetical protein